MVREAVTAAWDFLEAAESEEDIARERRKPKVRSALEGVTDAEVWAEIQSRRGALTGQQKSVKGAELETLLATADEIGEDRPDGVFYARTLPRAEWDRPWMTGIEKVVLVQRLREDLKPPLPTPKANSIWGFGAQNWRGTCPGRPR